MLYIHGTADETVPFEMAKALYDATPSARGLIAVHAAGHEDNAAVGGAGLRSAIGGFVKDAAYSRARMKGIRSAVTLAGDPSIPRASAAK